ncbi:MAG: tetratricopeptide repeat protein [Chloroherpetonaceae bacterium]
MTTEALRSQLAACQSDTERASLLNKLAFDLRTSNPAQSLIHSQEALALSQRLGDDRLIASSFYHLGVAKNFLSQYDDALRDFRFALELYLSLRATLDVGMTLQQMGIGFHRQGAYLEALRHHSQAFALFEELNHKIGLAHSSGNIANVYYRLRNYEKAATFHLQFLALGEEQGDLYCQETALSNLSVVCHATKNFTKALDYGFRALEISRRTNNLYQQGAIQHNIGMCYTGLKEFSSAVLFYSEAVETARRIGDLQGVCASLSNLGDIFLENKQPAEAATLFMQSIDIARQIGDRSTFLFGKIGMSKTLIETGNEQAAIETLSSVQEDVSELGDKAMSLALSETLEAAYRRLNQTEQASAFQKEAEKLKAELESKESFEKIRALLLQRESEQLVKQLKQSRLGVSEENLLSLIQTNFANKDLKEKPESPIVKVKTFGEFKVAVGARELKTTDWGQKKSRDVFKVLLLHHKTAMNADELIELVWGGASRKNKNAKASLLNAISFIRKALEPDLQSHQPSRFIAAKDQTYALDLGETAEIDFLQFKSLIAEAKKAPTEETQRRLLEQSVLLYEGDFLKENLYDEWSSFERESLKEQYLAALLSLAKLMHKQKNGDGALLFAEKMLDIDRVFEPAFQLLFEIYRERGDLSALQRLYRAAIEVFKKEFSAPPPETIQAWKKREPRLK